MITDHKSFLDWFVKTVRKHFSIGHEDVNDIMLAGQRVAWVFDDKTKKKKKYIGVTQRLNVEELEEISIPRGSSAPAGYPRGTLHRAFISLCSRGSGKPHAKNRALAARFHEGKRV